MAAELRFLRQRTVLLLKSLNLKALTLQLIFKHFFLLTRFFQFLKGFGEEIGVQIAILFSLVELSNFLIVSILAGAADTGVIRFDVVEPVTDLLIRSSEVLFACRILFLLFSIEAFVFVHFSHGLARMLDVIVPLACQPFFSVFVMPSALS